MLREDAGNLTDAIVGVDDERLTVRPGEGEWCAKEIAGHMVDIAELFCRRIRPAVEPETASPAETVLMPWKLIDGQDYPAQTADAIAARFTAAMTEALRLVGRVEGRGWSEKAEFTRSRVRLIDMASWLANHNVAHMEQLRARLA